MIGSLLWIAAASNWQKAGQLTGKKPANKRRPLARTL
jgi:hypothetical protein